MKLEFIGPFAELKTLGFEFQRLYAANYMQWGHDASDIRVWKKGREVTCNQLPEDMLAQMALFMEYGQTFEKAPTGDFAIAYWNNVDKCVSNRDDGFRQAQIEESTEYPTAWQQYTIKGDTMRMIQQLYDRRWVQVDQSNR